MHICKFKVIKLDDRLLSSLQLKEFELLHGKKICKHYRNYFSENIGLILIKKIIAG